MKQPKAREFKELNKDDIVLPTEKIKKPARAAVAIDSKKVRTMQDDRVTFTEEQIRSEASRCLSCGRSVVDPNKCIGCGICTTKCEFDAIHLKRVRPQNSKMIPAEDKFKAIGPYAAKRQVKIIKKSLTEKNAEVAEILPKNTDIPESENGRYTRGTAVALNARAYLYDNDFENCAIWCDKLINSTEYGTYALEQDYKKLFHDQSCCYGPESIMTIEFATLGGIDNIVRSWNNFNAFVPQSIGNKGVTTQSPTQELVDTYRKLDGSVADDTDYEKRDKRFEATIAYNNCTVDIPEAKTLSLAGSEGTGKGTYQVFTKASDAGRSRYPTGISTSLKFLSSAWMLISVSISNPVERIGKLLTNS